jgi:hypothetical protein
MYCAVPSTSTTQRDTQHCNLLVMRDDALAYLQHQRLDVVLSCLLPLRRTVVAGLHLARVGCVLADQVVEQGLDGFTELGGVYATLAVAGEACIGTQWCIVLSGARTLFR